MKKNLALILALVMLLGTLFSLAPMAEEAGTTPPATETPAVKYTPEITYSNLNYSDKMYMMFAVPAPASLDEGASVKLIVWNSRYDSISFSYNDIVKTVIDAEATTVKIGDVDHLVFKYDGLAADEMTNVICARPAVVAGDKATAYGKLVEYSVLEYVTAAKGDFEGIAGLTDKAVVDMLDSMLDFGALAQKFLSGDEPDFYANDDVKKIFVNPVVNGVAKDKVFAGFFKYDADGEVTFVAPFFDGTEVVAVKNADGTLIEDLDPNADGVQFAPTDSDITFTVEYQNMSVRALTAEELGPDFVLNNSITTSTSLGSDSKVNMSGPASTADSAKRMNYWHGFKTVPDPENPDGLVLMVSATNAPALQFNNTKASDWAGYGFGDTVYPAFTFELELGAINGKMPTTGKYYFRHRPGKEYYQYGVDLHIFTVVNGVLTLPNGTEVGKIAETGMTKFAVTVDALTNEVYGYCEDENGVMQLTAVSEMTLDEKFLDMQGRHLANLADDDPSNDTQVLTYESIFTFFTTSNLEPTWVVGSGPATNPAFEALKSADGTYDMEAVQALAESEYSFLLDNFKLTLGAIYE